MPRGRPRKARVRAKTPKTRDERAAAHFRTLSNQYQNRLKLESGEIDEEYLWERAYEYVDRKISDELLAAEQGEVRIKQEKKNIIEYRKEREKEYRTLYAWNTASDEQTLANILDNECYTLEVTQTLESPALTLAEREKYLERHSKLVRDHKDLLIAAGIDRLAREKKQQSYEPLDDWLRIKQQAYERVQSLKQEFPVAAAKCETEADLRDVIKYHFGFDFEGVVDPILREHRRVLGISTLVEQA